MNLSELGCAMGQQERRKEHEFTESEIEQIARTCHEVNRGLCVSNGDMSQPHWENAPDWQRESCIDGVKKALAQPFNTDPRRNHDSWMEHKLRDGWCYGETKDADAKVHPCLLPYESLPPHEKIKNQVFLAVVHGYWRALAP